MEKVQGSVKMHLGSQLVTVAPHLVNTVELGDKIYRDTCSFAWGVTAQLHDLPHDNPLRGWVEFFDKLEHEVEEMADCLPRDGDAI